MVACTLRPSFRVEGVSPVSSQKVSLIVSWPGFSGRRSEYGRTSSKEMSMRVDSRSDWSWSCCSLTLKPCRRVYHVGMLTLLLLWHGRRIPTASQGMSSHSYWYAGLVAVLAWKGTIHSIPRSVITQSDSKHGLTIHLVDQYLALQSNLSSRIGSMQVFTNQ